MQTMVRIVLLFPSVFSVSFCENRKHLDFIIFYFYFFLRFWLFLSSSRFQDGFSSLKKRFKNHDGETARPANHEMESFGRVP